MSEREEESASEVLDRLFQVIEVRASPKRDASDSSRTVSGASVKPRPSDARTMRSKTFWSSPLRNESALRFLDMLSQTLPAPVGDVHLQATGGADRNNTAPMKAPRNCAEM